MSPAMTKSPLILALDGDDEAFLLGIARLLREYLGMVKVGFEPFTALGPGFVRKLVGEGLSVFLDLKLFDIPRTVSATVRQARRLGVSMISVHSLGGPQVLRAAADEAQDMEIAAVTVLTSFVESDLSAILPGAAVAPTVSRLGHLALQHGATSLICSGHELGLLSQLPGRRVVPGVRLVGDDSGDQARVMTPVVARAAGATWLVVGRPILGAEDPLAMAQRYLAS